MNSQAKKIVIAAQYEGEESLRYIQCDLDESGEHPRAMLFWPSTDGRGAWHRLEREHIVATPNASADYVYTGSPIPIPKVLAELRPAGLTDDAFRLGFFQIDSR